MARYGLDNFQYDIEVADGSAHFKFFDPEDAGNTQEVSVSQSDFPDGVRSPDSREVADLAYAQVAKLLNDKRDARLKQAAADALEAKRAEDARQREVATDFLAKAQHVEVQPDHVEADGTRVYNTASPDAGSGKKKEK